MIASENQRIQASVLGGLLNGEREGNALGIYFSPAHCYTRGGLYKQEKTSMDLWANAKCNVDFTFTSPFEGKADDPTTLNPDLQSV